ncbi:proline-, glutamic acid- and leucine-rich protein 1-like [Amphibalanus amphitrite]|uniref:proline-, glutamic acid- and leucine-rich protein 1-like n=1 Tax=Amphibalanus amphitrite TaxID=1232801 RepID=UPI001C918F50|nr:proline-, glutamic acid- and leucine-rich protein 1-like [Amphibalanus amphitrite]
MELQAARRAFWDVRAAALRMLEALIGCCGVSLVQRATALNGLLVSALQAPAAPRPSPAAEAAHRQALRTVRAWLTAAGAGCGLQDQAEKLITMLSEDVRPPQSAKVTLQTNPAATNGVTTNPSKKKRRGAGEWLEADLSARQSAPVARRPGRCLAALEVLCQLATALGPLLTVSAHRAAQQLCVGLLLEVQRATGAPPQPYDRPACRAGLYRLLRALVADPHPAWPAPVQFAVGLFAHGARDEDSTVSMLCQDSQALCSRIVQPAHPTLFFPVDLSAWSKPPSSTDPADGAAAPVTDPAAADGTAAFPAPSGGPAVTTDVTNVSNDVRGAPEAAKDIPSDVSECGSSDTVRLGSRLGSVTAAAAAAAATPADSRAGSPPGASAPNSSRASPRPAASTAGLGGGRASPPERKPPAAWLAGAAAAAGGARGEAASVTTVTIASSESSASADGRRSVELAEMEEDQKSIVLGGSEDGEEESRPTARRPAPDESDEVEILETKRPRRQTMNDDDLAPDVAEMLKDFVNEDPEVE